ncbi:MAG: hypothetical protein DCC57_05730 [Chloroflexi bacterium]|nr:MAG: hypothetical protein DCC57_05730 [Chloroflexota bacterium]
MNHPRLQSIPHSRWGCLLAALLAALLLTACGGQAPDNAPSGDAGTVPSATATAQGEATATPEPPAQAAPAGSAAGDAGPTVAPPDLAEPGPVATISPTERNMMYEAAPDMQIDPAKYYYATLKTNRGDVRVQLFADRAPKTVNNFVFLARQGFYDNTVFHRVLDGFMAQAGDPTGSGAGGPGYEFEDEIVPGLVFDQSGLLAMANRGPNTNGSQFFITFGPTEWLNGNHTIFGKVIEGEDVLGKITRRDPQTDPNAAADVLYTVLIEESDTSILPTPTPSPPTPTPTMTPTPFAPTSAADGTRPLAALPAAERANYFNTAPAMEIDPAQTYTATITTSRGTLTATLYAAQAPVAVNNFVVLANLGFYDDMPISQVQPDNVIVTGSPDNNLPNDVGYQLAAEMGQVPTLDIGAISYFPMEQRPDGTVMSSGSMPLIALIELPDEVAPQYPFFAQIVEGVEILPTLTTSDTSESITISQGAP